MTALAEKEGIDLLQSWAYSDSYTDLPMLEAVGHPVLRLVRTRIGPLTDPTLEPGAWRPLTIDEVRALAVAAVPTDDPAATPE